MSEGLKFATPHEELAYLRSRVLEAERQLGEGHPAPNREAIVGQELNSFRQEALAQVPATTQKAVEAHVESLNQSQREVEVAEMMKIAQEKGLVYVLGVAEKLKRWAFEDDFHSHLVQLVLQGMPVPGIKEKGPVYQALHMTLYEVLLPKGVGESDKPIAELFKSMEQFYAGLLLLEGEKGKDADYMVFEVANPEGDEDTHAFVSVPTTRQTLFEHQIHAMFPKARLIPRQSDYNIFGDQSVSLGSYAKEVGSPAYPIKTFENFSHDPLNVVLSTFSKMPSSSAGAALQIVFRPRGDQYTKKYQEAVKEIEKGKKAKEALRDEGIVMSSARIVAEGLFGGKKKDEKEPVVVDQQAIDVIRKKLESPIVETNIRLAVSAGTEVLAKDLMHSFQSAFNQFEDAGRQGFAWETVKAGKNDGDFYRSFSFRLFDEGEKIPLNLKELSTILHFHTDALVQGSALKQSKAKSAPAPAALREEGTLIGLNSFQGVEKKIYLAPEDRLRHFYVIGQTGTGKSTLLKNMIIDDIRRGEGVCMIDPHGSDVQEVLASVPPERAQDVIYFDPAYTARPMALNMLEYDPRFPEQKTFVVNELFSIFQKLYGGVPESMGPMFEQYFRNATMLVIEDPESGSTLLDVSRVMANKEYRDLKLSRCKNPVVSQFWNEVAGKAGGDAALANVVPYITSKFDVFLANDIMRPIIAQEKSSFNFREIMDKKKILLVNLSKGRLGDINANLIGLILVGKILMAALSRVDSLGQNLPPFYLTIDEFQNITTDSIATILSEARKYKLSLVVAHQFIAQIDPKIKDAVFGNVGSVCAFRVGQDDAEYLEKQFAPVFSAADLANIDNFNAHVKLLISGKPTDPFDIRLVPKEERALGNVEELKQASYLAYGSDREAVEAGIRAKY